MPQGWGGQKVAVITGASSGVGRAIACQLAQQGTAVALVGRDESRLPIKECSVESLARAYVCDLAHDDIAALAKSINCDFGRVDVLVHSAGIFASDTTAQTGDHLEQIIRLNLRAPFELSRSLLPSLVANSGDIVFINSSAGMVARQGATQYAISKHGLRALADGLRDEVNILGVRVSSIFLGRTATPMQAAIYAAENRLYDPGCLIQPDDVANVVVGMIALPRTVEVTDIVMRPLKKPA
jgi:NADP-dependent 3-hydroxy acid dehydrogenase YdfG